MKKQKLPTLAGGKHARSSSSRVSFAPPVERLAAPRFVVAVVPGVRGSLPAQFAVQLVAALAAEGAPVSALVSHDELISALDAEIALGQLLAAGAQQSTRVRADAPDSRAELAKALSHMPADHLVVALGQALPLAYRPAFSVLVTGPHPPVSSDAVAADLVLATPGERLATDLAHVLAGRFRREASSSSA